MCKTICTIVQNSLWMRVYESDNVKIEGIALQNLTQIDYILLRISYGLDFEWLAGTLEDWLLNRFLYKLVLQFSRTSCL